MSPRIHAQCYRLIINLIGNPWSDSFACTKLPLPHYVLGFNDDSYPFIKHRKFKNPFDSRSTQSHKSILVVWTLCIINFVSLIFRLFRYPSFFRAHYPHRVYQWVIIYYNFWSYSPKYTHVNYKNKITELVTFIYFTFSLNLRHTRNPLAIMYG